MLHKAERDKKYFKKKEVKNQERQTKREQLVLVPNEKIKENVSDEIFENYSDIFRIDKNINPQIQEAH